LAAEKTGEIVYRGKRYAQILYIIAFRCNSDVLYFNDTSFRPEFPAVRATSLFKLENRNWTRLVQKPKWTRLRGKSENVYCGTRTLCLIDRGKTRKSVYRSTRFHFCP